jgi:hypothetical protein
VARGESARPADRAGGVSAMLDWHVVAVILGGGCLLTLIRRWDNHDQHAGAGVAGWTITILGVYLVWMIGWHG